MTGCAGIKGRKSYKASLWGYLLLCLTEVSRNIPERFSSAFNKPSERFKAAFDLPFSCSIAEEEPRPPPNLPQWGRGCSSRS